MTIHDAVVLTLTLPPGGVWASRISRSHWPPRSRHTGREGKCFDGITKFIMLQFTPVSLLTSWKQAVRC